MNTKNTSATDNDTSSDEYFSLARAWLAFWQEPEDTEALNRVGVEIDPILRNFLSRRFRGTPPSWRHDVLQEAGHLLYWRYLVGNKRLTEASKRADRAEIENQIHAAAWTSLQTTIREFRRRFRAYCQLFDSSGEFDDKLANSCRHPAQRTVVTELSLDERIQIIDRALRRAAIEGSLSANSIEIARTLLSEGCSQSELADTRGVSRQAISQCLDPVRRYLREAVDAEEFPLS